MMNNRELCEVSTAYHGLWSLLIVIHATVLISKGLALKPIWDWWSVKQVAHVSSSDESDVFTFNPSSSPLVSDIPDIPFPCYSNKTTPWLIPVPQPVTIPSLYKLQAETSRAIEIGPCPRALKLVSSFCATYWNQLVLATP